MRTIPVFLLSLLLPLSAFAQPSITFDPPDPTSRTPVYAHIRTATSQCALASTDVTRSGHIISVTLISNPNACYPFPVVGVHPIDTTVDLGVLPAGVYDVVASPNALLVAVAEGSQERTT